MKKMTILDNALELLNTLIHSSVDEMVKINKTSLFNIKICLQNATGSGKTLLMHVNVLQYRHYASKHGKENGS